MRTSVFSVNLYYLPSQYLLTLFPLSRELAFKETNVFECLLYNATILIEISYSPSQTVTVYDVITYHGGPITFNTTSDNGFMPEGFDYYSGSTTPGYQKEFIAYDKMMKSIFVSNIRHSSKGTCELFLLMQRPSYTLSRLIMLTPDSQMHL